MRMETTWRRWCFYRQAGHALCRFHTPVVTCNLAREQNLKLPEKQKQEVAPAAVPTVRVDAVESTTTDLSEEIETWLSDSDSSSSGDQEFLELNADSQDSTTCSSRSSCSSNSSFSITRVRRIEEALHLRQRWFERDFGQRSPSIHIEQWMDSASEDQDLGDAPHFAPDIGFGMNSSSTYVEEGWSGLVVWPNYIPRADIDMERQRMPNRVSL